MGCLSLTVARSCPCAAAARLNKNETKVIAAQRRNPMLTGLPPFPVYRNLEHLFSGPSNSAGPGSLSISFLFKETQAAWRPLPKALDVDRICSFLYQATVGNDNTVRLGGMILDIPPGPRRRGYAKARVEVRQLLDGRWRVYDKDELLLETPPPLEQAPLRTLRRRHRRAPIRRKTAPSKIGRRKNLFKARLTNDLRAGVS